MKNTRAMLRIILFFTTTILLMSCSPKIGKVITKTYPEVSSDIPVTVFMNAQKIPVNSESLGVVKVGDSGFTTNCDSVTVVDLIKTEARKVGGNAVLVTEYRKPSFWGSSCHQMVATVLKVNDFSSSTEETDTTSRFVENKVFKPARTLPRVRFSIGGGYGWRTAETISELNQTMKNYLEELKSGPVWDASFNYYFNDNYGIGLIYSAYTASNSEYLQELNTGNTGYLDTRDFITYVGPAFMMRFPFAKNKCIFDMGIGFGYIGYKSTVEFLQDKYIYTGSSVGFQMAVGLEYRISNNWGIGFDLSTLGGSLDRITINENGEKTTYKFESGEFEGLGHFRMLVGVRYHIK